MYRTLELPAKYWDEQGAPKFFNRYGNLDHGLWVANLDETGRRTERYSSLLAIDKSTTLVKAKADHKLLGEVTTFFFRGGWIGRAFGPDESAKSCKFISDAEFSRRFYGQIFRRAG